MSVRVKGFSLIYTLILNVYFQEKLLEFLSSENGMEHRDQYKRKMKRYLSRVGRLMGITADEFK